MRTPFRVSVLLLEEDNLAGFSWSFAIWVALRKSGRYSVGASYRTNEPPAPKFPTSYPLKSGEQIWEAVCALYLEVAEEDAQLDLEDARDVARRLSAEDPALAAEVLAAATAAIEEWSELSDSDGTSPASEAPSVSDSMLPASETHSTGATTDEKMRKVYARLADQVQLDPFGLLDD